MVSEKEYRKNLRTLRCVGCGALPVELHHITSMSAGMGKKTFEFLIIPLCWSCHLTGKSSIHQNKTAEARLLSATIQQVLTLVTQDKWVM